MHQKSNLQDCFFNGKIYKVTQSCLTLKKRISYLFHICFIFLLQTLYNHFNILQLKFEGFSNIHVSHKLYEYDLVKITLKIQFAEDIQIQNAFLKERKEIKDGKGRGRGAGTKGKYRFLTEFGKQERGGRGEGRGKGFGILAWQ